MKAKNIEEFFGTLQQSTVEAWKSHLKTDKYSKHIALNDFYEDIVDLVDTLIEDYMGLYGKVENYVNIMSTDKMGAIDYLKELHDLVTSGRKELIDEKDTELHSDIDAILSLIDSTLYKLKELDEQKMSIVDYIKNHMVTEASTAWRTGIEGSTNFTKGTDMLNCAFRGYKKFGFLCYNEITDTISLVATDSPASFAEALNLEEDDKQIEKMFRLAIGDQYKDTGEFVMRIW